jgi:hypothetical protein
MDTHPRLRAPEEPTDAPPDMNPARERVLTVAQAACCFNCLASKQTPFFRTNKVMAAILRARVSRSLEDIFQIVIMIFVESANSHSLLGAVQFS